MEVLVTLGIFSVLVLAIAGILIISLQSNRVIWDQLTGQSDARRVLREVVDTTRRAEISSLGAYPIESADPYELILYANINADSFRERIRFFLERPTNLFKKGITLPAGLPLRYDTSTEAVTILARDVVNDDLNIPVFSYYDESYTGSSTPISTPVSTTLVHVVKVEMEIEHDPGQTPVPIRAESTVMIRNLKTN